MKSADVSSLRMLRRAKDRFTRAFRTAYGETPGRYRARRRVEPPCELLRSANLTVTEICHLVGFTSLGTFSARFAEQTGMSPTAYRREAAERGGAAPIPGCFAMMCCTGLPGKAITSEEARPRPHAVQSPHDT